MNAKNGKELTLSSLPPSSDDKDLFSQSEMFLHKEYDVKEVVIGNRVDCS